MARTTWHSHADAHAYTPITLVHEVPCNIGKWVNMLFHRMTSRRRNLDSSQRRSMRGRRGERGLRRALPCMQHLRRRNGLRRGGVSDSVPFATRRDSLGELAPCGVYTYGSAWAGHFKKGVSRLSPDSKAMVSTPASSTSRRVPTSILTLLYNAPRALLPAFEQFQPTIASRTVTAVSTPPTT